MNVSCPECRSVFRVDPSKVPTVGVRARCSVCGGVITIASPSGAAVAAPSTTPERVITPTVT
ncbi:MAG: zinc-ribbon domain-containing protein, partial [Gemmatimonadaceae bacterium]|nr:zinc-ribbon domain-containing protein [Gemmatimonadaceae bacterium]